MYCQVHVVTALEESASKYSMHQVSLYEKFCIVDSYLNKMFYFKNDMIKLTGAVSFPTRMQTEENTCEVTCALKTNRREEYLLCR